MTDRIYKLDQIRVLCALAVLLSNLPIGSDGQALYNVFVLSSVGLLAGKLGVEVMLVMSGYFFMRKLIANDQGHSWKVLRGRLSGVYPLLFMTATVGYFVFDNTPYLALITTLYNVTSAMPNYHDPYAPLWTLGVIIQVSFILAFAWRSTGRGRSMSTFLIVWIIGGTVTGLSLDVLNGAAYLELNYKSAITRGIGMCVGALLAINGTPGLSKNAVIGAIVVSWIAAVYGYSVVNEMVAGIVPFTVIQLLLTVAASAVFLMAINSPRKHELKAWSIIAKYTFAFYVLQYPVLSYFEVLNGESFKLMSVLMALVCCALMSVLVEKSLLSSKMIFSRKTKAPN